ncbi:MAG: YdiU family protein [Acidimicrobiaceae bacterium]|nr:YdiU family protein [Acidimicrobiaceae bacterium]
MLMTVADLAELEWDNSFTRELAADENTLNRVRQVHGAAYSRVMPTPTEAPTLIAVATELLEMFGLDHEIVENEQFVRALTGNAAVAGTDPHAMCYGGHQFGNWAGQLGDGRAITLGEVLTASDGRQTLQLKGAGPTPYSRTADGLAVLRSSIREFLCSEAMHHLGVPTTRALSVALTGDKVMRDMFYDGRPALEQGAVVCRVAPSFIRFGNFEIYAARGDTDNLRRLADYTITTHFAELLEARGVDPTDGLLPEGIYVDWFAEVARRTADMVVHWQRVGFVHGVMNTDNMSIHGLTIDYGPYGWLEDYDPGWTPNTTDASMKRYRFGAQPHIASWNLERLANAIYPLVEEVEPLESALNSYVSRFNERWPQMMAEKLGIAGFNPELDQSLIEGLLELLPRAETDMTLFFRGLAEIDTASSLIGDDELLAPLASAYYLPDQLNGDHRGAMIAWLRLYRDRVAADGQPDSTRRRAMNSVNPKYVLRNYLAQLAIDDAEQGDFALTNELLDVLRRPYDEQPGHERFAAKRPDWARARPGCSMLSCSS